MPNTPKTSGFVYIRVQVSGSPAALSVAEAIVFTTDGDGTPVVTPQGQNITLPQRNKNTQFVLAFELVQPDSADRYAWTGLDNTGGICIWNGPTMPTLWPTFPSEFSNLQTFANLLVLRDGNDNNTDYQYCLMVSNRVGALKLDPRIQNSPN